MDRSDTFLDALAEVRHDEITASESGVDSEGEARANQWAFSITPEQATHVETHQVVEFVTKIVDAREEVILKQYGTAHPMIFYCWFDEQAVQLRFSLVSAYHGSLPFGCPIRLTTHLTRVAEQFLRSPYHGGIPVGELFLAGDEVPRQPDETGDELLPLDVWSIQLPRTSSQAAAQQITPADACERGENW